MKTNLFKAITAASTAALMLAIPVSSAYAAVTPDNPTPKTDIFVSGTPSDGQQAFSKETGATSKGDVVIKIDTSTYPESTIDEKAVYKVDVTWEKLTFTYTSPTWNANTHVYEGGTWNEDSGTITVTNHSNWGITHDAKFSNSSTTCETKNNVKATITPPTSKAIAACPISAATAPSAEYEVSVALADENAGITVNEDFVLDTITVTITPNTAGASNKPTA